MAITTINSTDSGSASLTKINDNFADLDTTKADINTNAVSNVGASTDNAIARFDSTTGKLLQNSLVLISDLNAGGENEVSLYPATAATATNLYFRAGDSNTGVGGSVRLQAGAATTGNNAGGIAYVFGSNGFGSGAGGEAQMRAGPGGATGAGGAAIVQGGVGGATSGAGGPAYLVGGDATNGDSDGGTVYITPGPKHGSGADGKIKLAASRTAGQGGFLDLSLIASSDKTFTFPNETGTFALEQGAWTEYTVTPANLTKGAGGILTGYYQKIGKTVICRIYFKFGSGSAVSGDVVFSLPVTSISYPAGETQLGNTMFTDSGTDNYFGMANWASTTTIRPAISSVSGTKIVSGRLNSTSPFTWTTNDDMTLQFVYEAA